MPKRRTEIWKYTMNLNLYEDHLGLFTDLNVYCKKKQKRMQKL